jgi:chemotaxis protein MotB
MARRRRREERVHHERWLVSYADFITLLFAFFVVMYAMSSVHEGKYRVLSDTLADAFNARPKSLQPIPVNGRRQAELSPAADPERPAAPGEGGFFARDPLEQVEQEFRHSMLPLINQGVVSVTRNESWVELELNTTFMFLSGSARLEDEAVPVLRNVAEVLQNHSNAIQVEGFTDNLPISTPVFRSNWELSAARAASVVHLFMDVGVAPERMSAIGYGEYQPVADNTTAEGRRRNRRVVVVVLADHEAGKQLEIQHRAAQADGRS